MRQETHLDREGRAQLLTTPLARALGVGSLLCSLYMAFTIKIILTQYANVRREERILELISRAETMDLQGCAIRTLLGAWNINMA